MGEWWWEGGWRVFGGGLELKGHMLNHVFNEFFLLDWLSIHSLFCILAVYIAYFEYLQVHLIGYLHLHVKFRFASIHSLFLLLASKPNWLFVQIGSPVSKRFLKGSENFCQKSICSIMKGLVRNLPTQSKIRNVEMCNGLNITSEPSVSPNPVGARNAGFL